MINRILKLLFALPLILAMVMIIVVNVKLGYKPETKLVKGDTLRQETLLQLHGIKHALNSNADIEMQSLFPEGYLFLNALYALAWTNFLSNTNNAKHKEEAQTEIERSWSKINSEQGKSSFTEELPLSYGAFYNGWSSYMLGKKLEHKNASDRSDAQVEIFKDQCRQIAVALEDTTYPVSYYGGAWPADVVLCVAALSLHDKLFEPLYKETIRQWLDEAKVNLDPFGMLPHAVHPGTGKVLESARGSSMALMLIFLREIDPQFANEQFNLFKTNFIDTTFGLTGVREYPKGKFGTGDVDSGPVLLGYGGAATIVGAQTLALYGEIELGSQIRGAVEAMAFGYTHDDRKQYFFGYMPIADAFIAWGDSSVEGKWKEGSFVMFRICSAIVFTILAVLFWVFVAKEKGKREFRGEVA